MKQTAVEWLIEELRGPHVKGDFIFNGVITSELIDQSKEMEKQQIVDAYSFGIQDEYVIGSRNYYNETFKNTEQ